MFKRFIHSVLTCLTLLTFLSFRAECAVYNVIIYQGGQEIAHASGFWVSEDRLLTSSMILDWGDQFFIEDPSTGTRYLADVINRQNSMALLSVQGLSIGNFNVLSIDAPEENSKVHYPVNATDDLEGLLSLSSGFDHRYRFTMAIDSSMIGAPLMNRCDEVISVVSAEVNSFGDLTGVSENFEDLVSFLRSSGVAFNFTTGPCPTIEDQLSAAQLLSTSLQGDLDSLQNELKSIEDSSAANLNQSEEEIAKLNAQKSALEKRITDTLAKQDSVIKQGEDLQIERDSLIENTRNAQAQIDSLIENASLAQAEIDSLNVINISTRDSLNAQEEENRRRLLLLSAIAIVLILIAAILLFLFWKRRRDAEQELLEKDDELRKAEEEIVSKSASFQDVVLHGYDLNNNEIRIKVKGKVLAQNTAGFILGRSSESDGVIVENSVSRRHARMSLSNNVIMIEDLNSLNGTVIDGMKLSQGEKRSLSQGSKIVLGDVSLTLTILQ